MCAVQERDDSQECGEGLWKATDAMHQGWSPQDVQATLDQETKAEGTVIRTGEKATWSEPPDLS